MFTPQTSKASQNSAETPPVRSHIRTPQSEKELSMSFISLFGSETSKYDTELLKVLLIVK